MSTINEYMNTLNLIEIAMGSLSRIRDNSLTKEEHEKLSAARDLLRDIRLSHVQDLELDEEKDEEAE